MTYCFDAEKQCAVIVPLPVTVVQITFNGSSNHFYRNTTGAGTIDRRAVIQRLRNIIPSIIILDSIQFIDPHEIHRPPPVTQHALTASSRLGSPFTFPSLVDLV